MATNSPVNIYITPAGLPPPGVVPNIENPFTLREFYLLTFTLCIATTTIAVSLRIFTKVHIMRQVRAEDYALIVAQYVNYIIILYGPLVFLSKLSVLLQLQHIFITTHRQPVFFVIQALIWANLAFYVAYFFVDVFQCTPRSKIWDTTVPGKCISLNVLLVSPAGINIISDSLILVLPIVLVFRLKTALKNKLTIVAVFSSGLFAVISSVLRLVYSIRLTKTTDVFWAVYPVAMWAAAELATVILAATFPVMLRLWAYIQTGDRTVKRYTSNKGHSALFSSSKTRKPKNAESSASSEGIVPVKGGYKELQDGEKGHQEEGLEMQIRKTDIFEVTSHPRGPP